MLVFLKTVGAALILLGIGLGVVFFTKSGLLNAYGIGLETAVLLLVGGILANGQAGIISALTGSRISAAPLDSIKTVGDVSPAPTTASSFVRKVDVSNVGAGTTAVAVGAAAIVAKAPSKDPVADTISALEQAKADVIKSIGGMDAAADAPTPAKAEAIVHEEPGAVDEETAEDDDGLYVVEEKVVRGRPARILSDDTVEAETDEGWMRFENMEHLNEYLDSAEEQSA
ncbi:MAG: hypothetical protein ABI230_12485 [Aestuariivirga sp.]